MTMVLEDPLLEGFVQWPLAVQGQLAKLTSMAEDQKARSTADLTLLNAIRATQSDHSAALAKIDTRLGGVESNLAGVNSRLDKVEAGLAGMSGRLGKVETRLDKVESRLDKIDGRLDKMDGRLNKIDEKLDLLINREK